MKTQLKKGVLEIFVLGVLSHEDSYGYKIVQDLSEVITISESTLYPILRRLESKDSIGTYQQEYNGRLRKYYHIKEKGRHEIQSFMEEWEGIKEVYDFILRKGNRL
ncbi:MAG: PadR family transcriptional regulator [Bacilli bacterium]|jgi:PadR family transcriptional regulator PadR|nr:PadR family transcriptional regulator [Bacilli bacterium]